HYNCVYVAVTIPTGAHTQTTYTVSEIEYIADTYINADGTDEFMNNNSTVSIGLPYNASAPTVSDFAPQSLTVNSCAATLSVTDASGLVTTTGGWLGIAVYDGENIIANKPLTLGSNSVSAGGLIEDTHYWVVVYLFADLHDGRGVTAHVLYQPSIQTPAAIEVSEAESALFYDTVRDGYYGAIRVQSTLNSATAEYVRLEIVDENDQVVYTDTAYNGSAVVSENIYNGSGYCVRIYYSDTEYPEGRCAERDVWVPFLGTPWLQDEGHYAFVTDAIYYFRLNNNDENYPAVSNFTIRLRNESSARWIAADVLELIANENAIEEAQAKADRLHEEFMSMERGPEMDAKHAEWDAARGRVQELEHARDTVAYHFDDNWDRTFWEAEAAKGKYFYEITYNGSDTDKIFKANKTFYVLLEDAMTYEDAFSYGSYRYEVEILYQYDNNEGNGLTDGRATYSLGVENTLTSYNAIDLKDVALNGNSLTFSICNVGDWLADESEEDENGYTYYQKAYVYQIFALNNWNWDDKIMLYEVSSTPTLNIDEEAWLAAYIDCIKAGEDTTGLYAAYVPKYSNPYTVTVDLSALSAGQHRVYVNTRHIADTNAEDEYEDQTENTNEIYKKLPTPTMTQNGCSADVDVTDDEGWWGAYTFEAYDKSGQLIDYVGEGGYFQAPAAGTRVRVRLETDGYWLQSDWSEWYHFDAVTAPTVTLSSSGHATWSVSDAKVSGFVYRINNGGETPVDKDGECSADLTYGQTLFVKAVASEEARALGFEDSEWASVYYERPSTGDKG
ncbi:MAG: hypothetical protein IKM08_09820, partial [Clostridia bacterium]|nr:hypothetical protein [Clostridia bacterium]